MSKIHFKDVGIRAISACVPKTIERTRDLSYLLSEKEIGNLENVVGIKEKRISSDEICSSDLCFASAKKLLAENDVNPESIDVLLFMSKTPDYVVPTTSTLLQERLGLSHQAFCLDLRAGCSGYIQALSLAFMYASLPEINRVLVLNGDTLSRCMSKHDKSTTPIFGDAGAATLVEKGNYGESWFDIGSDGSDALAIHIPASLGGRKDISKDSFVEKTDENGNSRSDVQMYMNGMNVFSFAISTVPKTIKSVLEYSGLTSDDIGIWLLHQANSFINKTIAKKMKIQSEKVLMNIDRFGNTTHASIPLLISSERGGKRLSERCLMAGFGSGLSWGSAILNFTDTNISELIEI